MATQAKDSVQSNLVLILVAIGIGIVVLSALGFNKMFYGKPYVSPLSDSKSFQSDRVKNWKWETFKIKFDLPVDFSILTDNDRQFSASNQHIRFVIYPRKGENVRNKKTP